tara:strand:- start:1539 stop:3074 length:1536 start_codon:yes stop_codon:yes gene_type:complete
MIRITSEFVQTLTACQNIGRTNTAKALLLLSQGEVHSDNLLEGDVPLFINKSVDSIGKLSFTSKKRIEYNSWDDGFAASPNNSQRVKAKVGKTLSKIFTPGFMIGFGIDNGDMEAFTSQIKGLFLTNTDQYFSIGTDFSLYNWEHTSPSAQDGDGSLGSSCMRNDRCIEDGYFDLYEDVDTPVELVVFDEGDGISSRALLWTLDEGKFLDRIYETADGDIDRFKSYAQSQGWHTKERQSYNSKLGWTTPSGEVKDINLIIPIGDIEDHCNYPYMDTMTWAFKDDNDCWFLTNSKMTAYHKHGAKEFYDFQSENGHHGTDYIQEIHYFTPELIQSVRATYNESTVTVYAGDLPEDSIIDMMGESELEFERYEEGTGDRTMHRVNSMYYHLSELHRCDVSSNFYPKSVKLVAFDGLLAHPSQVVKTTSGSIIRRRSSSMYYSETDQTIICLASSVIIVRDMFGVLRDTKDCTYIGGFVEKYVLTKELALVKLMTIRAEKGVILAVDMDELRER